VSASQPPISWFSRIFTFAFAGNGTNEDTLSGLVYFSGIFTPKRCEDMWGFGVHPILSNPLKYSSPKILYHNGEFSI
jgi:hypothetical protein